MEPPTLEAREGADVDKIDASLSVFESLADRCCGFYEAWLVHMPARSVACRPVRVLVQAWSFERIPYRLIFAKTLLHTPSSRRSNI